MYHHSTSCYFPLVEDFEVPKSIIIYISPSPESNNRKLSSLSVNLYLSGIIISAQELGFP